MFRRQSQRSAEPTAGLSAAIPNGESRIRASSQELIALRQAGASLPLRMVKALSPNSGGFLSRFKGRGMEFDEARPYEPGDDVRNLDWRVTARTGKPHTKLFREERERSVLLWVDYRAPMHFATKGCFKSVLAARAAAILAWSATQHGDRLGSMIFSETQHQELRPKRGKKAVLNFIHGLAEGFPAQPSTSNPEAQQQAVDHALARLRRVTRPGSLLFLISDFRHLDEQAEAHLTQLSRHNELVLLFLYDPLEQQLPPAGWYRLSDGQHSIDLHSGSRTSRQTHERHFLEHQQRLRGLCQRTGMHLLSCSTDEDLLQVLQMGLGRRAA